MNVEQALRQSLDLLSLRVTSNRGGYPRHEPVPSDADAIENLAASIEARITEPAPVDGLRDEDIARLFHEAYERLAPSFGYETRTASAVPWADVPEPNRSLMVAVAGEVRRALAAAPQGACQTCGGSGWVNAPLPEPSVGWERVPCPVAPDHRALAAAPVDGLRVRWDDIEAACPDCGGNRWVVDGSDPTAPAQAACPNPLHVAIADERARLYRAALAGAPQGEPGLDAEEAVRWAQFVLLRTPAAPDRDDDRLGPRIWDWACAECTLGHRDPPTVPGFRCVPHAAREYAAAAYDQGETR